MALVDVSSEAEVVEGAFSATEVTEFDVLILASNPPGPSFCPGGQEDLSSVAALGTHYNSFHGIHDSRLLTKPSFQCS